MTAILLVAGFTLAVSFFCSLSEAALYATSPSQAETLAASGRMGAQRLRALRASVEEPITAILTLNTVANTAGAAWFGSLVAEEYGQGSSALAAGTAVLTFAILLIAEIIPKSLGVRHATRIAPVLAWPLQLMIWLVWPVVKGAGALMGLLSGSGSSGAPTEDEVVVMARMAAQAGALRGQEHRWVKNALELDKVLARDIMTPRTVVRFLPSTTRLGDVVATDKIWTHSRVPVTEGGDLDRLLGIVYRKDVLEGVIAGDRERVMGDMVRPIDFVPETMRGHRLLAKLINERVHMVAVLDEHGGVQGVVTLEDVLESLIGSEIVDEYDEVADMRELAREQGRQAAALRIPKSQPEAPGP